VELMPGGLQDLCVPVLDVLIEAAADLNAGDSGVLILKVVERKHEAIVSALLACLPEPDGLLIACELAHSRLCRCSLRPTLILLRGLRWSYCD
jgi:hypothetical protein